MQCKCGPEMIESTHTVTTEKGKLKWLDYAPKENIEIQQWECKHCGRIHYKVWVDGWVVKSFG